MEITVRNAAQAVDVALAYLSHKAVPGAPDVGIKWQEKTLYSPEPQDLAITGKLFTSNGWVVEVSQNVAPLSRTVYEITMFYADLNWYWQGKVKSDGTLSEDAGFRRLSTGESEQLSAEFQKKARVPPHPPGGYGH